jgi:hypothetical protein
VLAARYLAEFDREKCVLLVSSPDVLRILERRTQRHCIAIPGINIVNLLTPVRDPWGSIR